MTIRTIKVAGIAGWIVFLSVGTAVGLLISNSEAGGLVGFLVGLVVYMVILCALIVKVSRLADKQDSWRGIPLRSKRP